MKAKEVQQGIIDNLFPFLNENGFKKRKNGFTKQDGDFSSIVFYSWLIGDNEFPTSFSFMVASHLIYKMQRLAFNEDVSKDGSTTLVTLNQSLVFKMKPKEFEIESNEDIILMCEKVKSYLEIEGFQFFKSYQNYHKILDEMKLTSPGLFYGQGFVTWSLNALVISKMLDDPDYNLLLKKYLSYCEEYNLGDNLINKIKVLDTFLRDKSSVELLRYLDAR